MDLIHLDDCYQGVYNQRTFMHTEASEVPLKCEVCQRVLYLDTCDWVHGKIEVSLVW